MHVTYYSAKLKKSASVKKIRISEEQYKVLVHYIEKSFALENNKPMLIEGESYSGYIQAQIKVEVVQVFKNNVKVKPL